MRFSKKNFLLGAALLFLGTALGFGLGNFFGAAPLIGCRENDLTPVPDTEFLTPAPSSVPAVSQPPAPPEKWVCLTFDDGPIPEVTPWVLELLKKHDIKATFFMVGDNIRKHPDEYRMVVEHGHRIGNHTFNHIRGFEYSNPDYLANTRRVDEIIHSDLFRPPHGHMGFRQYYTLRHHYRIIMWDLVTRDYSKRMRPEQVLNNVKRYVRNGSIITFHDSLKSWNNGNLQYALPRAIEFLKAEGYVFKVF